MKSAIRALEVELAGDINEVKADIKALNRQFDERSKSAIVCSDAESLTRRNIDTGSTVMIVSSLSLMLGELLFFGSKPSLRKGLDHLIDHP